jgi:hypothetical protein
MFEKELMTDTRLLALVESLLREYSHLLPTSTGSQSTSHRPRMGQSSAQGFICISIRGACVVRSVPYNSPFEGLLRGFEGLLTPLRPDSLGIRCTSLARYSC